MKYFKQINLCYLKSTFSVTPNYFKSKIGSTKLLCMLYRLHSFNWYSFFKLFSYYRGTFVICCRIIRIKVQRQATNSEARKAVKIRTKHTSFRRHRYKITEKKGYKFSSAAASANSDEQRLHPAAFITFAIFSVINAPLDSQR